MAKIIIPKENFLETDVFTEKVALRFRIVTDDQNVFSYWSPIYSIDPEFDYISNGSLIIEKHSEYIAAIWNPVLIEKDSVGIGELPLYDLWVRWGTDISQGEWEYKERVSSTSINLLKPTSPSGLDHISIEIYRPGRPITRKKMSDVYQDNLHIDLVNNTITFDQDHNFVTGEGITYNSSSPISGLSDNQEYWVRTISSTQISLFPTENDAQNNTNKIDLNSHPNSVGFFTKTGCTVCHFLVYSSYNFSPA